MAKKASKRSSSADKYTHPEMRERIKERLKQSDKGGAKGQWSARKAQMLASEYKEQGGGFRGGKEGPQKNLDRWTKEEWTTEDGSRARKGGKTTRYLPKQAWKSLSGEEKEKTQAAKERGSRQGKQFVGNTPAAKASRKKVSKASKATGTSAAKGKKKKAKTTTRAAKKKRSSKKATSSARTRR